MKFEPLQCWVIGRTAITRASRSIILAGEGKKVTRFVLLEQVSPEAEAAGFHVGDFVVPRAVHDMFFNYKSGTLHLVTFPLDEIICKAHDLPLDDLIRVDGAPFEMKSEIAA